MASKKAARHWRLFCSGKKSVKTGLGAVGCADFAAASAARDFSEFLQHACCYGAGHLQFAKGAFKGDLFAEVVLIADAHDGQSVFDQVAQDFDAAAG
jgi:hypothetical protein